MIIIFRLILVPNSPCGFSVASNNAGFCIKQLEKSAQDKPGQPPIPLTATIK